MKKDFYPESPINTPSSLTRLSFSYNLRTVLAVFSIILFFTLYFSLVSFFVWLLYLSLTYEMTIINKFTLFIKLASIAGSAMLLAFTVKFILKIKNIQPENRIEINKSKNPKLADFINNICKETGAPKPKAIFADPDVNAYVSYNNMWMSLIMPVRKNLTLGLSLIEILNLTEFKAVVAHEFGHFAQRSMKIGSYIGSANTIIYDMIYNRDKWDNALERARKSDIRIAIVAYAVTGIIILIRQMLRGFYFLLNIIHSSLSREMEFNADKTAVRVTGSDAIISALWKLDYGAESWNTTLNNIELAAQKSLYSENLYKHNSLELGRLKNKLTEDYSKLQNHKNGGKNYFIEPESSKTGMYASHPSNDQREKSAKEPYIPGIEDSRSPWILFEDSSALQKDMTSLIYKQYLKRTPGDFRNDDQIEAFIAEESQGREILEEYCNTFKGRFLYIPSSEEIKKYQEENHSDQEKTMSDLKKSLYSRMEEVRQLESLIDTAQRMAQGTTTLTKLSFDGTEYTKKNLETGYSILSSRMNHLMAEGFKDWDISFCATNLSLAEKKSKAENLKKLYLQHELLTKMFQAVLGVQNSTYSEFNILSSKKSVSPDEIDTFTGNLKVRIKYLNETLDTLRITDFHPLPNIRDSNDFIKAVIPDGKFPEAEGLIFENGIFQKIMSSLEISNSLCRRLERKSLIAILSYNIQ